jgi:hypothetical protein
VKVKYPTRRGPGGELSAVCPRPRDFAQVLVAYFSEDGSEVEVVWYADTGPMPPTD